MKKSKFEVYYHPEQSDWNAVLEAELKRHGLKHGQVSNLQTKKDRAK
jgi:hypothetical protein